MATLTLIGLIGGLITGVSPCVLPMLPIIFFAGATGKSEDHTVGGTGRLAGADEGPDEGPDEEQDEVGSLRTATRPAVKRTRAPRNFRPLVIIAGLVTSFSAFTLLGSALLSLLGLPDDFLRWAGVIILGGVGLGLIVPPLGHLIERPFYRLPKVNTSQSGAFVLGLGLGTLYVPCAGPVLAAITVAGATGDIGLDTVVLTVSFATGAALPLLFFAAAGQNIAKRIAGYRKRARTFRTIGGVVMLVLAVGLVFNLPQLLQRAVPNYTGALEETIAQNETFQGALAPGETDENRELSKCEPGADELAECGPAPALRGTQQWFNTPGDSEIALDDLQGKVVMLDFWAYSCINCQRDEPYISAWYEAYGDLGLEVVGIHSPEFAFEKDAGNVQSAINREEIAYPVVQDNDLDTWRAYRNRYWPAKYLIDTDGTVRAIKFGEGSYEQTETLIRELLRERDPNVELPDPVTDIDAQESGEIDGDEIVAGIEDRSPEMYLSRRLKTGFSGPEVPSASVTEYQLSDDQRPDTYSIGGSWRAGDESLTAGPDAQTQLHFRAANVYHVLSGEGTVTISRDGQPDQTITVTGNPNSYQLIEGDEVLDETITLTYSPGIEAFTFTFG